MLGVSKTLDTGPLGHRPKEGSFFVSYPLPVCSLDALCSPGEPAVVCRGSRPCHGCLSCVIVSVTLQIPFPCPCPLGVITRRGHDPVNKQNPNLECNHLVFETLVPCLSPLVLPQAHPIRGFPGTPPCMLSGHRLEVKSQEDIKIGVA